MNVDRLPASPEVSASAGDEPTWDAIEAFIAELAEKSQADLSFQEYGEFLLQRTLSLVNAAGGAVWTVNGQAELCAQTQHGLEQLEICKGGRHAEAHARFLQSIRDRVRAASCHLPAQSPVRGSVRSSVWIASPIVLDETVVGVLEVIHQAVLRPVEEEGQLKLLRMAADLAADFLRGQELRQLRRTERMWQEFAELQTLVTSDLDLQGTAFRLVNAGRSFVGCDRITVVIPRGQKWKVLAISGVDTFERRAEAVRKLEQFARTLAATGQGLTWGIGAQHNDNQDLAPQIAASLSAYLDVSHPRAVQARLLNRPAPTETEPHCPEACGALLLEQFDGNPNPFPVDRVERLQHMAQVVVRNALDYDTLPLRSVSANVRKLRQLGSGLQRQLILGLAAVISIVCGLVFLRGDFYVHAEGELQPENRREIFAPYDAEVAEVFVQHDEQVEPGEVLLTLRSPQLDLELQRLQGEYQTTQKKLLAIASARVQARDTKQATEAFPGQLAAEEQELKQLLANQQEQLRLVRQQREQLTLRSPIGGRVLTWNPNDLLDSRPVQRGQLLMSTADVDGPWNAELWVPEDKIAYLLAARAESSDGISVLFSSSADSSGESRARVKDVASRTEVRDSNQAAVRITAAVEEAKKDVFRPGASIRAKIDCGKKSLGYIWFHDIFRKIQEWLLF